MIGKHPPPFMAAHPNIEIRLTCGKVETTTVQTIANGLSNRLGFSGTPHTFSGTPHTLHKTNFTNNVVRVVRWKPGAASGVLAIKKCFSLKVPAQIAL